MKSNFLASVLFTIAALPSQAAVTFSFIEDTWSYDVGPSTVGFLNQTDPGTNNSSKGYLTEGGVTLTFTATFVGTAVSGAYFPNQTVGSSMTNVPDGLNPPGFVLSTQSNDSTGLTDGIAANPTVGAVTSYQRWHFEFSKPVILDTFLMEDIDNLNNSFRDILGAEAFTSITPGVTPTAGTGINPTFGLGSSLSSSMMTIGLENLSAVYPIVNTGNPASTDPVNASVSFGTTEIRAFSIYAISNTNFVHRMSLDGSSFTVIPEPSSSVLGLLAMGGLLARRRR